MMHVDLREGRDAPHVSTASAAWQEALHIKRQYKGETEQGNPEGMERERERKKKNPALPFILRIMEFAPFLQRVNSLTKTT